MTNKLTITLSFCLVMAISFTLSAQENDTIASQAHGVDMARGTAFAIATFSLRTRNANNDKSLLANYIDYKSTNWNTLVAGGYMFKPEVATGLGLSYGEEKGRNTILATDGTLTYNNSYSNTYLVSPFVKNFIPLNNKHRFYIITQTEISYSLTQTVTESTTNNILTRSNSTKNSYGINLRPGLLLFIVDNFGFETTVNVFGINSSVEKTSATGQPDSKVATTDIDFRITILALTFSFSLYF